MADQFTAEEFQEEADTLKTLSDWREGVRPSWRVFAALRIAAAAVEWANARLATTDSPVVDVRKDDTFRTKLDRLAKAEERLSRLALIDD